MLFLRRWTDSYKTWEGTPLFGFRRQTEPRSNHFSCRAKSGVKAERIFWKSGILFGKRESIPDVDWEKIKSGDRARRARETERGKGVGRLERNIGVQGTKEGRRTPKQTPPVIIPSYLNSHDPLVHGLVFSPVFSSVVEIIIHPYYALLLQVELVSQPRTKHTTWFILPQPNLAFSKFVFSVWLRCLVVSVCVICISVFFRLWLLACFILHCLLLLSRSSYAFFFPTTWGRTRGVCFFYLVYLLREIDRMVRAFFSFPFEVFSLFSLFVATCTHGMHTQYLREERWMN